MGKTDQTKMVQWRTMRSVRRSTSYSRLDVTFSNSSEKLCMSTMNDTCLQREMHPPPSLMDALGGRMTARCTYSEHRCHLKLYTNKGEEIGFASSEVEAASPANGDETGFGPEGVGAIAGTHN